MDPQRLFTRVEIKAVDTSQRIITGYAGAIGNKDRTGDIIDKGAFDRTIVQNTDVVAFIGHDSSKLPVGEPIEMRADANGLFTTTSIYNTPDGDALLEVARRRLSRGKTLGMSIGYRTVKQRMENGTRHLLDVDLVEYSFLASPDFAANPLATVLGVKAKKDAGLGQVISVDDSYEDLIDDIEEAAEETLGVPDVCVMATFPTHVIVQVTPQFNPMDPDDDDPIYYDIPYTLDADGEPTLGEPSRVDQAYVPSKEATEKAAAKLTSEEKTRMPPQNSQPWDAAFIASLPDNAFAHIEGDGIAIKDDTGRTVPRALRHYPHHNQDGSVDASHLAHALEHAEQTGDEIAAKALAHLAVHAHAEKHGFDAHAPEWSEGAIATVMLMSYKLDSIIADLAKDRLAMERMDMDTKKGARINSSMRVRLKELHSSLGQILDWADSIEKGDDGKMRVDMFRHKLAMLQLQNVS